MATIAKLLNVDRSQERRSGANPPVASRECFSKLGRNPPTVLGDCNEDRLAGSRVWVCVLYATELNLASGVRAEGGGVGKKSSFRDNITIQIGIERF